MDIMLLSLSIKVFEFEFEFPVFPSLSCPSVVRVCLFFLVLLLSFFSVPFFLNVKCFFCEAKQQPQQQQKKANDPLTQPQQPHVYHVHIAIRTAAM